VTICNVYPFGHGHGDEKSLTSSQYKAAMTYKKQQWPYERLKLTLSNLTVAEYDAIWGDLSSHIGYATSMMPTVTNQQRASQSQQLIVDCLLFDKDWYETAVSCKSTLHFHWDQTYLQCYTIRIPRNMTQVRVMHLFGDITHISANVTPEIYLKLVQQRLKFNCVLLILCALQI